MRFLGNIETTVGQVVKDLKAIAKSHPDEVLTFPLLCFVSLLCRFFSDGDSRLGCVVCCVKGCVTSELNSLIPNAFAVSLCVSDAVSLCLSAMIRYFLSVMIFTP